MKRITLKEISKISGYSRGTVDRAMNNRPGISAKSKKEILRIAKEMGYRPNYIGQALVTGKTKTVGVVLFGLKNTYFTEVYTGVENSARSACYLPLLALSHKREEIEKESVEYFLGRQVDGLILVSVLKDTDYYEKINIPIVAIGNRISPSVPFVGIDDRKAVLDVIEIMVKKGYREIVFFCPPLRHRDEGNIYAMEERYMGYIEGIHSYEGKIIPKVMIDRDEIYDFITTQRRRKIKTAILCSSDSFALDILNFMNDNDIHPDTIGIAGFDHLSVLKYIRPNLCSVDYSKEDVGKLAFDLLNEMINKGSEGRDILVEHHIVEGDTV